MTATVMTRLASTELRGGRLVNATDPELLSRREMEGRRQALDYVRFLVDRVPGYERASLASLSSQVGVRETRRVHGDERLTADDVLSARQFPDQVGLCGAPIEDHHGGGDTTWRYLPDGRAVGIPFGTLVVRDAANVLVAGRCFSATHAAHASVRSMAQCMAMGQAAGTAAAMAVATGRDPRAIDVRALRDRLRAAGLECHATEDDVVRVFVPGVPAGLGEDQQRICGVAMSAGVQIRVRAGSQGHATHRRVTVSGAFPRRRRETTRPSSSWTSYREGT